MSARSSLKRSAASGESSSSSKVHTSKKTRFVDPSEDPVKFEEQVEESLEKPSRKGKVKTEGYQSDSSDDGKGVVFSRKKDADADDDDDDMFAAAEKEEKKDDSSSGKNKEKYMRLGDIEGQEFGGNSGSENDSNEDDIDAEDDDDAERKKKAGMGFELSSFNMREEMEEGKFTEDGTYVRTFDAHAVHDKWMEGLSEKEIKLARRRKRQQEKLQKERMEAEEKELQESGGKGALEKQLLPMLKKGETVLEALQRLGRRRIREAITKGLYSKAKVDTHDEMVVDKKHNVPTDIEHITHLASTIMSFGETDIYSKTYEELVREVRSSGSVDESWEPPSADVKYEYKWAMSGAGPETFGPFSEDEIKLGEKIKIRPAGGEWGDWEDVVQ
ncbi:hypothetical protein BDQ17DRAFT_1341703 [Cyathus striatus]|nr:hypothetical protein BDQ17DRAFT_1341703 [Cyathus striatus]